MELNLIKTDLLQNILIKYGIGINYFKFFSLKSKLYERFPFEKYQI